MIYIYIIHNILYTYIIIRPDNGTYRDFSKLFVYLFVKELQKKTFFLITHVNVYIRILYTLYIYMYANGQQTIVYTFFFSTFLFFGSYKFVSSVTSYIDLRQKTLQPLNQSEPNGLQSDIVLL